MHTASRGMKELCMHYLKTHFEPSSPCRHAAELYEILQSNSKNYSILFLYYCLTCASVKLTLITLFRMVDLDYLFAARTATHYFYHNPAERVMSVFNLGLQSIVLLRRELENAVQEKAVKSCQEVRVEK